MARTTGTYRVIATGEEKIRAFVPAPLPPSDPPLKIEGKLERLHAEAVAALGRLGVAGAMVPSAGWFLYGFVRKEAVVSSQIEGTEASLVDVLTYEATRKTDRPAEVEEICNYVEALAYARTEIRKAKGLPLCTRLLCEAHKRLMHGVRGADKHPGAVRKSQNWIGGDRPGTARFVPPPANEAPAALSTLERWIHGDDDLPPLVRIGLAHVQFETIHPFLDGNGRIGRLLIALLVEHWRLLESPLLYLSLAFKRHRADYYRHLMEVRTKGDWEGWTAFFLNCVTEAAEDGVSAARRIYALLGRDRTAVADHKKTTVQAIRLFDLLPEHPVVTLQSAMDLLDSTKPTTSKAIDALRQAGVLHEVTGRKRDRIYTYADYLEVLAKDTEIPTGEKRRMRLDDALQKINQRFGKALRRLAD